MNSPAQSGLFVKYYGEGLCRAVDLASYRYLENGAEQTGYMVLAQIELEDAPPDFYMIRLDKNGNAVKSEVMDLGSADTLGLVPGSHDVPKRIKPIGNGEFLVVGYVDAPGGPVGAWTKMDTALARESFFFIDGFEAVDIIETSRKKEVILLGNADNDIHARKHGYDNGVIWREDYGFDGTDRALAIFENEGGSLFIVGSTDAFTDEDASKDEGTNLYFFETSSLGTEQSSDGVSITLGGDMLAYDELPTAAIRTNTGAYAIAGRTKPASSGSGDAGSKGFVMLASPSAKVLGSHVFEFYTQEGNNTTVPLGLAQEYYGNLSIVGRLPGFTENGINRQDEMMVMRVNPVNGFTEEDQDHCSAYGRSSGNDEANAVIAHPEDGDLVVAGTVDFGNNISLVCVMKLSRTGGPVD